MAGISWRSAAAVGATLAGAVAAGAAARVASDRGREKRRGRRGEQVPFGSLHSTPRAVLATDGVSLNVEVDEPGDDALPLTVVFVHGWVLDLDCWHYQRAALRGRARLVFFDQRSHGRSGRSDPRSCTLDQLGQDLRMVLEEIVPDGPIVLVGHSMGGMSVMALAAEHPDLVSERVVGVVLISTSAGNLLSSRSPIGRVQPLLGRLTFLVDQGRKLDAFPLVKHYAVGPQAPEKYADMTDEMITRAPTYLFWDFYPNFVTLDLYTALPALPGKHTIVIQGGKDQITPPQHAQKIADLLEDSQLVVFPDAGHMIILEEHERIDELLIGLIEDLAT